MNTPSLKHHADLFLSDYYPSLLGKSRPLTDDVIEGLGASKDQIIKTIDSLDCSYDHQVMIKISLFGYQSKITYNHSPHKSLLSLTLRKAQSFANIVPIVSIIKDEEDKDKDYPSYLDVMVDGLNYSFVIFDLATYIHEEFERHMRNNSENNPCSRFPKEDFNNLSSGEKSSFISHTVNKEVIKIMKDHKRITTHSTIWFYDVIEYECTPYFQLLLPEEDGLKKISLDEIINMMEEIVRDYKISHHNAKLSVIPYETIRFY